jgi:hypothetical protein
MATQVAIRQRDNSFRDKLGRYVAGQRKRPDRRRKAAALTAKMARVAHAVIKTGTGTARSSNGRTPDGRTPLCRAVGATATL